MIASSETRAESRPILIVDSDPHARRILRDLLRHRGIDALDVATGEEALEVALRQRPAAIVTELYLPCGSFQCLARALAMHERLRDVPVIAFTAYTAADDRDWARDARVAAYVPKPEQPSRLLELLASLGALRVPGSEGLTA